MKNEERERAKEIGERQAFPASWVHNLPPTMGMTYREHLIGCALTGLLANPRSEDWIAPAGVSLPDMIAKFATDHADATLAALAREGG